VKDAFWIALFGHALEQFSRFRDRLFSQVRECTYYHALADYERSGKIDRPITLQLTFARHFNDMWQETLSTLLSPW